MIGHEIPNSVLCELNNNGGYIHQKRGHICLPGPDTLPIAIMVISNELSLTSDQREQMNVEKLPTVVISSDGKYNKTYIPDRYFEDAPYEGRLFIHGLFDCYTLISDWFYRERKINLPWNVQRPYGWWDTQQSLYMQHFREYGFTQSTKLEAGDVMLFNLKGSVVNHAAVYLGDNMILHHLGGRISCKEPLSQGIMERLFTTVKYTGTR